MILHLKIHSTRIKLHCRKKKRNTNITEYRIKHRDRIQELRSEGMQQQRQRQTQDRTVEQAATHDRHKNKHCNECKKRKGNKTQANIATNNLGKGSFDWKLKALVPFLAPKNIIYAVLSLLSYIYASQVLNENNRNLIKNCILLISKCTYIMLWVKEVTVIKQNLLQVVWIKNNPWAFRAPLGWGIWDRPCLFLFPWLYAGAIARTNNDSKTGTNSRSDTGKN